MFPSSEFFMSNFSIGNNYTKKILFFFFFNSGAAATKFIANVHSVTIEQFQVLAALINMNAIFFTVLH